MVPCLIIIIIIVVVVYHCRPCRSVCESVRHKCDLVHQWPIEFDCSKFPDEQHGEACVFIEGNIVNTERRVCS